jgi:hypothetical protein
MDVISAFCAKTVMWMDIFAAVSQLERPRFLGLYRILFQGGVSSKMMATTNGASSEVMHAFAEIADLACWKNEQKKTGSLSTRDLVAQGAKIEESLRQLHVNTIDGVVSSSFPVFEEAGPFPDADGCIMTDSARRELAGRVFHQAALLYLYTVLSECNPNVPEIQESVKTMMSLLQELPPSEIDRSLVFPICLAGCLTDLPTQRLFFHRRLVEKGSPVGNVGTARLLMETVWNKRDSEGGRIVCWQEVMRDLGHSLLLV